MLGIGRFLLFLMVSMVYVYAENQSGVNPPGEIISKIYNSWPNKLPEDEEKEILDGGSNPTYGEMAFEGIQKMLKLFEQFSFRNPSKGPLIFLDIGSGSGKVVAAVCLLGGYEQCKGIEISPTRSKFAQDNLNKLLKDYPRALQPGQVKLIQGDALNIPMKDATRIWISSLLMSEEFLAKLTEKLSAEVPAGTIIATSRALPDNPRFKHLLTTTLEMSWTKDSNTNFYMALGGPAPSKPVKAIKTEGKKPHGARKKKNLTRRNG